MPPADMISTLLSGLAGAVLIVVLTVLVAGVVLVVTYLVLAVACSIGMAVLICLVIAVLLGSYDSRPAAARTALPPPGAAQRPASG